MLRSSYLIWYNKFDFLENYLGIRESLLGTEISN